jgi:hypothetical protein
MRESIRYKCDLFADNYIALKDNFVWGYAINNKLGALLYAMENRTADIDSIKYCRQIIKDNTGIFSQFKDITLFMTSVILSLHADPVAVFNNAVRIYDTMREERFHSSPYLVLASVSIALQANPEDYQRIINTARNYYDAMKEQHYFLTSSDDYGLAALLALSGMPIDQTIREMEECYGILKQEFFGANAVQTVSQILTFSTEHATEKCRRAVDLYQALKYRGCKFTGIELSFLGVIALLQGNTDMIADEIAMTNDYLKDKKGFGYWSISAAERLMFAAALVCDDFLEESTKGTMEMTLANNIAGIILAQQTATMAAIAASSAAAAASTT